jgi:chromate transporter
MTALLWPTSLGQVTIIAGGAVVGRLLLGDGSSGTPSHRRYAIGGGLGLTLIILFFGLLIGLPIARGIWPGLPLAVFDSFYRAGSLVFGGGHVVLPLLQAEVGPPGWVRPEEFIAGYGAAQAVPGPLFSFSAYLGALMQPGLDGLGTALLALVAIYVPSFLLLLGILPFWDRLRALAGFQSSLRGVNAAVVGLLLAALYQPVWTSAVKGPGDLAIALAAFLALALWKLPPWLIVILTAIATSLIGRWL